MVVWLQLSYRQVLCLEYWLAQCKAQSSMWIMNQKLNYIMYRYFSAHAKKRVAGWNGWCNGMGNVRQCKGCTDLSQLCSSVRETPLNILKWALCGLYKNSGSGEMGLMVWSWSDTIRNGKGAVGWDRQGGISWGFINTWKPSHKYIILHYLSVWNVGWFSYHVGCIVIRI